MILPEADEQTILNVIPLAVADEAIESMKTVCGIISIALSQMIALSRRIDVVRS